MNSTAAVLRRIKDICIRQDTCRECPLDHVYCNCTPESWSHMDIEKMEDVIDNYEEVKDDA